MNMQTMTVRQFCDCYNLSHSTFYRLQKVGEGPATMRVGRRVLIPIEHARDWARARLSAAA